MTTTDPGQPESAPVRLCTHSSTLLAQLHTQGSQDDGPLTGVFAVSTVTLAGNGTLGREDVTWAIPADSLPDLIADLIAVWGEHQQRHLDQSDERNPGPVDRAMILAGTVELLVDQMASLGPDVHPIDRATSSAIIDMARAVLTTTASEFLFQLHTYGADPATLDQPSTVSLDDLKAAIAGIEADHLSPPGPDILHPTDDRLKDP